MKTLERRLKAVASANRLRILKELKHRRTADVSTLARVLHLSIEATSLHLRRLHILDIIQFRKRGNRVFYRLSLHQEPPVRHVLSLL